jgi:hypothetical protein
VIRAHEVQQYGYAEHWFKQDSLRPADDETENPTQRVPPVITVFSAPNYCDLYQNKVPPRSSHSPHTHSLKEIVRVVLCAVCPVCVVCRVRHSCGVCRA